MATTENKRFSGLLWAGRTDMGHKRKVNEDCLILIPEYGVLGVADGIGGGDAGDVASHHVAACLQKALQEAPEEGENLEQRIQRIQAALLEANRLVREHGKRCSLDLCGSTVVLLVLDMEQDDRAMVVHAGDSRLYRMNDEGAKCLTRDHNAANEFSEEVLARLKPHQHQHITRAVGIKDKLKTEVSEIRIGEGDRFLLCTDGLFGMYDPASAEAVTIWGPGTDLEDAADYMINQALKAGGRDNISLVLSVPQPVKAVAAPSVEAAAPPTPAPKTAPARRAPKPAPVPAAAPEPVPEPVVAPKIASAPPAAEPVKLPEVPVSEPELERIPLSQAQHAAPPSPPPPKPDVRTAASKRPTLFEHHLVPWVLGVIVGLFLVVGGIAWYQNALNRRAKTVEEQIDRLSEVASLRDRIQQLQSVAELADLRAGEDYSESRWQSVAGKMEAALLDGQQKIEVEFVEALDGLSMDGPSPAFFQHMERLLETSSMLVSESFTPYWTGDRQADMMRRGADMQDVFKMVRYWDVLRKMDEVASAEEIVRGETLLARIVMLDRDGNPFVRRVREHPVMAGMRVQEIASQQLELMREEFDQCIAEDLIQYIGLPWFDVEPVLDAMLGEGSEANQKERSGLIVRNKAKLQADGLKEQLSKYAPVLKEPTDLQEELKYLDHTRIMINEWNELQQSGVRP